MQPVVLLTLLKSDLEIGEAFKDQYVMLDRVDGMSSRAESTGVASDSSSTLHLGLR